MMDRSLNETAALAGKSIRGAGASWSSAQEVTWATRMLCAWGLNGAAAVAALCRLVGEKGVKVLSPMTLTNTWQAEPGPICPVRAGTALADSAAEIPNGLRIASVASPIMVLPFAHLAAQHQKTLLRLDWAGGHAVLDGATLCFEGSESTEISDLVLSIGGEMETPVPQLRRAKVHPEDWATLEKFAARTYAPASAESRASGAGDGT